MKKNEGQMMRANYEEREGDVIKYAPNDKIQSVGSKIPRSVREGIY